MQPVLLDTSVYVSVLRQRDIAIAVERFAADTLLWLSAVVLEELYAGARERDWLVLEQWERDFGEAGRILVPNQSDWSYAGKVLRRLADKYDYETIGRGCLTNDALIVINAARMGIRVITANEKDFRRLAQFCSFPWQLATL
jgi:predicted nucleic acid-binding protein